MNAPTPPSQQSIEHLLSGELRVINVGVALFAEQLQGQHVPVLQLDWRPPAGGDERLAEILAQLT